MSRYEKYREAWCRMLCANDEPCRKEMDVGLRCLRDPGESGMSEIAVTEM